MEAKVLSGTTYVAYTTENFTQMICGGCGIPFFVPEKWRKEKVDNKGSFSCPNGCSRVFVGETEAEKLRKQLLQKEGELYRQRTANEELNNELWEATNKAEIEKAKRKRAEKKLLRVYNGVCPCCNRNFKNLHSHMQSKHPGKLGSAVKNAEKLHVKINNKAQKK